MDKIDKAMEKKYLLLSLGVLILSCSASDDLLNEINNIPMIYTAEAVAEVFVEETDADSSLKSWFGHRDIIVPVRANVKAGIDCSKITDVVIENGIVKITLPDPQVEIESTKILNNQIVSKVSGLRSSFTSQEEGDLAKLGREKIKSKLPKLGLIEQAYSQAEALISDIVEQFGYNTEFSKKTSYSEEELPKLFVSQE